MTTGTLALIIMLAIVVQVILVVLIGAWRRRRRYLELNVDAASLEQVLPAVAVEAEAQHTDQAVWEGFKPFRVVRRTYENASEDICSFYLAPNEAMTLPAFKPGQFLTFKFDLQPERGEDKRTLIRCYSLSDRPRSDLYRISVKRVAAPVDKPTLSPGRVSNYLHDHVQEGDLLMVKAPSGHFHLIEKPPLPLVLIAGGIGITPMLSIVNTLMEQGSEREVWLFYGVRNGREAIMQGALQTLAQAHHRFHLHLCYSRPGAEDRHGIDYQHAGHIDMALLQDVLKLGRYQFYVCGPGAMMSSIVPGLEKLGVPTGDIHYEAFGPATLTKPTAGVTQMQSRASESRRITFTKSEHSAEWTGAHETLLNMVEAEGIDVDSACRAGSCGSCQTRIESGEVEYSQTPDADVEAGHCLLCISRPKSDLKLAL